MNVIPSLSFKNQNLVIVEDGKYERYTPEGDDISFWGAIEELSDYETMLFLDIDGVEHNNPQVDLIRKASTRKEVWADVGARNADGVTDAFIAGADKVLLSTKTIVSKEAIEESIDISDDLILSIDYKDGLISPSKEIREMGIEEMVNMCTKEGIDKIVYSDLSDGGFDGEGLNKLPRGNYELYIAGAPLEDIDYVKHDNLESFIVGYEEAVRYQKN